MKNIDTLDASAKIIEKLRNDEEMARLSYTLATINREVPIELDYEVNKVTDINKEEVYPLFKKLAFNKFLAKYDFDNIKTDTQEKSINSSDINIKEENVIIVNKNNIEKYLKTIDEVLNEEKISYILNINYDNQAFSSILSINDKSFLSIYSASLDKCYIISLDSFNTDNKEDKEYIINLLKRFANSTCQKLGYNIKQDQRFFFTNICDHISNFSYDLLIACYLLDSTRNYKFEGILEELHGVIINTQSAAKEEIQLSLFNDDENSNENILDENLSKEVALATKGIYMSQSIMDDRLKMDNMYSLMYDIEMPLSETLASMETTGMYVNKEKLEEFGIEITKRIDELKEQIYGLAGEKFNINSPQQLGTILFEKLNLPGKKKTKTGYSTNKEVLEGLEEYHEIIPLIIEYRQTMKLKSTYVDGLRATIKEDSRIHTTFMQTVTSTGRLSSVEPNLQNIPIRLELGSKIRTFFTAPYGSLIADADYSQIELRVLSHISKDETMISAFNNNIDVHKVTASQVFDVPLDEVTKQMRSKAKAVNFGIVYGISEFGLAKNVGTSWREAKDYINTYLSKYHGIREFMENIVKEAKENGYVSTLFGRRRYIPELKNKNKTIVQFGERVAMNTPIQGTAADIIKIAMNNLYKALKENNLKSKLVMQVHDELIVETVKEELEIVKKLMKETMENVVKLNIPLDVDLNTGKSWYEAK